MTTAQQAHRADAGSYNRPDAQERRSMRLLGRIMQTILDPM